MAESDRLRLRQVTVLARIQTFREEQASRQVAAARMQVMQARQDVTNAAAAYEQDVLEQTRARHQRWQGCVGLELSEATVRTLRAEDQAGLASVEDHRVNQSKAQQAARQAQGALKKAEQEAVSVRNATARRDALKLRLTRAYKKHERLREDMMRDQQAHMLFVHRNVDDLA